MSKCMKSTKKTSLHKSNLISVRLNTKKHKYIQFLHKKRILSRYNKERLNFWIEEPSFTKKSYFKLVEKSCKIGKVLTLLMKDFKHISY